MALVLLLTSAQNSDWKPCSCSQNWRQESSHEHLGCHTHNGMRCSSCSRRHHCNTLLCNDSPTLAFCKTCIADAADWPCGLKPPSTLMDWGSSPTCPITAMPDSTTARTDAALWGPPPAVKESSDQIRFPVQKIPDFHGPLVVASMQHYQFNQHRG